MKPFFSLLIAGFAVLFAVAPASAAARLTVLQSTLTLYGTSTLHNFECTTTKIQGGGEMDSLGKDMVTAKITIPVKSIHSKSTSMDKNMYEALKAKDNPEISFSLRPSKVVLKHNDSLQIKGDLTIAGKTRPIEMTVLLTGPDSSTYRLQGRYDLLMTDYGIAPPTFMGGLMKTGAKISIQFDVKLESK